MGLHSDREKCWSGERLIRESVIYGIKLRRVLFSSSLGCSVENKSSFLLVSGDGEKSGSVWVVNALLLSRTGDKGCKNVKNMFLFNIWR